MSAILTWDQEYFIDFQVKISKQKIQCVSKFRIVVYFKRESETDVNNYWEALSVSSLIVFSYSVIKNKVDFTSGYVSG